MLYGLYRIFGTALFFLIQPMARLFIFLSPRKGHGLRERLGQAELGWLRTNAGLPRVWIHAASVGEVNAALILIEELTRRGSPVDIVLTTMTVAGLDVARQRLPPQTGSFLAPLDVVRVVRRVLSRVRPALYVCLEAELWPAMLVELRRADIPMVLLNGRMTARSYDRYRLAGDLIQPLLQGFAEVAAIREEDAARYVGLGVAPARVQVTGNVKFAFPPEDIQAIRSLYRNRLGVDQTAVFLCGSTRSGEERLLAGVYKALLEKDGRELLWVVAPRHLRRLAEVKALLLELRLDFDLYSELADTRRRRNVVLVDSLGELARIYSAGDYNFVGGSLVGRGGHNIMEPVRWGRPVYYGPHIDDFKDAAHILEDAGAGFRVADAGQLLAQIERHMNDSAAYEQACAGAESVMAGQQGVAARQVEIIMRQLARRSEKEQDNNRYESSNRP
ncbi:MAG: hypothetical protein C4563_10780 [Desulfobulbus sp.]|nr:MAG: hypothetical protein C4563_10780 [Desulfobulbus sp.]